MRKFLYINVIIFLQIIIVRVRAVTNFEFYVKINVFEFSNDCKKSLTKFFNPKLHENQICRVQKKNCDQKKNSDRLQKKKIEMYEVLNSRNFHFFFILFGFED